MIRRSIKKLIPNTIQGSNFNSVLNNAINLTEADKQTNTVRLRVRTNVLRVEQTSTGATVNYYRNGQFFRASCKAVILAGQMHTAHRVTEHLMSSQQLQAAAAYRHIPVPIANVAVNNSQFLVNSGPAYDYYWYGSRYWQDAVMADWVLVADDEQRRNDGSRPNVLTFYGGFFQDPATHRRQERVAMLQTPFAEYEASLREDMERVWGPSGFVWDRDACTAGGTGWCIPTSGGRSASPSPVPAGRS